MSNAIKNMFGITLNIQNKTFKIDHRTRQLFNSVLQGNDYFKIKLDLHVRY